MSISRMAFSRHSVNWFTFENLQENANLHSWKIHTDKMYIVHTAFNKQASYEIQLSHIIFIFHRMNFNYMHRQRRISISLLRCIELMVGLVKDCSLPSAWMYEFVGFFFFLKLLSILFLYIWKVESKSEQGKIEIKSVQIK